MTSYESLRDQRLLHEIGRITNDYDDLHRRTARDLARCRAELAEAHAVLGAVSHDLSTPLSAIVGSTELLLADDELTPTQRDLHERLDRAARSMGTLAQELVEAVTAGASALRCAPVDLSSMVSHAITRYQLLQPPRGVRVVMDAEPAGDVPPVIGGDEAKLERVLDNLVSNAVTFSPDDGIVRVAVADDGRSAEIRVRDDGPGLPAEELEKVFDPFHRAPGAAAFPGVGLGLTVVQQITERHGGQVRVESVLGAGATFVVRLPLSS